MLYSVLEMAFLPPSTLTTSFNQLSPSLCRNRPNKSRFYRPPRDQSASLSMSLTRNAPILTATATFLTAVQLLTHTPSLAQVETPTESKTVIESTINEEGAFTVASNADESSEKEMLEQTRRNTRLAGRLSQQFSTARRYAEYGDMDAALSEYNKLIEDAPNFAPAYSNRANILVSRNLITQAIADYDCALQLAPLDGDAWVVHVNRAVAFLARPSSTEEENESNARTALNDLNIAYNRKGADPLILQNRAAAYEALGKWDSAIRDYQTALSKGGRVQPFWLRYALVLFERGKDVECVAVLRRVASSFNVDDVKAAMAVVYFEDGYLAKAETIWSDMDRPRLFESRKFLENRKWPPRSIEAMSHFRNLKE